jgi:hypothetical protein
VTCPYYRRDGVSNPDTHTDTVNNSGAFVNMSDAVLYNTLAWAINGSSHYATNAASWINTWFIAKETYMSPNLNYGQMVRGPRQTFHAGRSSGLIDLKCIVKVVNAVLVLRAGQAPGWTSAIDSGLANWTKSYIKWLTSSPVALAEAVAPKCVTPNLLSARLWSRVSLTPAGRVFAAIKGRTITTSLRRCRSS